MNWLIFINSVVITSALESRVFNGDELRPAVHGYLVKLNIRYVRVPSDSLCSGSIISENWILTSAHCFANTAKMVTVYQTTKGHKMILATVSGNIKKHPTYTDFDESPSNSVHDIALLKTTRPIQGFNRNVWPIELAKVLPKYGQSAIIAGYGDNERQDFNTPREGFVQVRECNDVKNLLCSFDKARAGSGDSGGALMSKGRLLGVTSASCIAAPQMRVEKCLTVYASVAVNFDWIMSVMKEE